MSDVGVPFGRRVHDVAEEHPDRVALWFVPADGADEATTWADLDRRSTQVARAMQAEGVAEKSLVVVALRNSPEHVLCALAAWKLGAAPIPMRWDLPEWERGRLLQAIDPALFVDDSRLPWIAATVDEFTEPLPDVVAWPMNGICSSGSTGLPKVILADRPALWDPEALVPLVTPWMEVERPQVMLVPAPLYHTNGFSTLQSLIGGDTLVLMERFSAEAVLDAIERLKITTFTATPTMLQRIARVPGFADRDFSSLRWVLQGAAVPPPSLIRTWIDAVGADRFFIAYGSTEGLGLTALRGDEWVAHPGSVGRGIKDTEVRVVRPDGNECAPGELGEIYLRWPAGITYRYLGGSAPLPKTDDGFGSAGDMGYLDEDGFLYIVDRREDLIVTGGANVFPAEVESALADHPGIGDVVVIGLVDEEWGQRVHAIVEPIDPSAPPTADDVIAFAKQRLAGYKAPKTVEIVDTIPRTAATKVSRRALVEARQ